ncbi:MAG: hypothetical protein E7398_00050 [Ruminococcaceae bacterium]|nr:hypothetical protein [Oscillospiraceae bacterium]
MPCRDLQHPDITKMMRDGTLSDDPPLPEIRCPLCDKECETLYKGGGEVIGCENCIERVDAYDEIMKWEGSI